MTYLMNEYSSCKPDANPAWQVSHNGPSHQWTTCDSRLASVSDSRLCTAASSLSLLIPSYSTWFKIHLGRQPHGHRPPPTPPKSQVCTLQKIKRISRHISIQCNTILLSTLINLARTLTPAAVPTALELIHVVYSTIFSIRSTREIQNLDKN